MADDIVIRPSHNPPLGALKIIAENAWFAARPSGTEDIYKIYAESFKGAEHLKCIIDEAQAVISGALAMPERSNGRKSSDLDLQTANAAKEAWRNKRIPD